jgi:methanogenic corrinoid protein MtbC1
MHSVSFVIYFFKKRKIKSNLEKTNLERQVINGAGGTEISIDWAPCKR